MLAAKLAFPKINTVLKGKKTRLPAVMWLDFSFDKKKTVRIENKQLFGYQSIFCTNVCVGVRLRENRGVGERENMWG